MTVQYWKFDIPRWTRTSASLSVCAIHSATLSHVLAATNTILRMVKSTSATDWALAVANGIAVYPYIAVKYVGDLGATIDVA